MKSSICFLKWFEVLELLIPSCHPICCISSSSSSSSQFFISSSPPFTVSQFLSVYLHFLQGLILAFFTSWSGLFSSCQSFFTILFSHRKNLLQDFDACVRKRRRASDSTVNSWNQCLLLSCVSLLIFFSNFFSRRHPKTKMTKDSVGSWDRNPLLVKGKETMKLKKKSSFFFSWDALDFVVITLLIFPARLSFLHCFSDSWFCRVPFNFIFFESGGEFLSVSYRSFACHPSPWLVLSTCFLPFSSSPWNLGILCMTFSPFSSSTSFWIMILIKHLLLFRSFSFNAHHLFNLKGGATVY